jgi:hypothetical protein
MNPLHDPRGDDPYHSWVPPFAGQYNTEVTLRIKVVGEYREGLFQDGSVLCLASPVCLLEKTGEITRFPWILGKEETEGVSGIPHPT